ncbi:MAG TPA: tryptophan 2,3-dioxygenase family protein [Thermoanaerobaculia bacterium]|jgi:tryptophan 2,3-dioxygenase|nr:tryptophan 2,3-dioxygenase family protein [Thermoanaerobaculia bacterium]
MTAHTGPILEGRGETDYERYVRVPELLELQKPVDKLVNPDEALFQTTHQAAELWLKQIDYELHRIAGAIGRDELNLAADLLVRCRMLIDLLREQIIILETMAPVDYHEFRVGALGRGSGQESPGFHKLLEAGKLIWPRFEELLRRRSVTVIEVERDPRSHYDIFRLIQGLLDYDEAFMKWRFTHMRLAFRIIGAKVLSLKGVPAAQLESGTREPLFPELWETISALTSEFKPSY